MHKNSKLWILGGVCAGLGFAGGWFIRSETASDSQAASRIKSQAPSVAAGPKSAVPAAPGALKTGSLDESVAARVGSSDMAIHQKALTEATTDVLNTSGKAQRMIRLLELLAHFRPGDSDAVVEGFRVHDRKGRLFYDEFSMFMDLSGRIDGLAAMERNKQRYTSPDVSVVDHHAMCMTAWAETSPEDAIKWWNKLEDGRFREGMANSIISGVVKNDLNQAMNYLRIFPEEDRAQHAGVFVQKCIEQGGANQAAAWLKTVDMPSGDGQPFQVASAQTLLQKMVNVAPETKAAVFEPLLDQPWIAASGCLPRIVSEWAGKDPLAASAWLSARQNAQGFGAAAAALAREWKKSAPEAAAQWEQQLNQPPK